MVKFLICKLLFIKKKNKKKKVLCIVDLINYVGLKVCAKNNNKKSKLSLCSFCFYKIIKYIYCIILYRSTIYCLRVVYFSLLSVLQCYVVESKKVQCAFMKLHYTCLFELNVVECRTSLLWYLAFKIRAVPTGINNLRFLVVNMIQCTGPC